MMEGSAVPNDSQAMHGGSLTRCCCDPDLPGERRPLFSQDPGHRPIEHQTLVGAADQANCVGLHHRE